MEEGKAVVRGALQIAEDRREVKSKGEGKTYPSECRIPQISKER